MKTKHFLILILLLPLLGKAQPYQSIFGQESTEWYIASNRLPIAKDWPYGTDHAFVVDTIQFQGNKWYQIEFPAHHAELFCREELNTGRIFARSGFILPVNELLIVDMSLEKNDTFKMPLNFSETIDIIVDTVYFEEEKKIIAFNRTVGFDSTRHQLRFIEGVGPTNGLLEMHGYYGYHGNTLLCAKKDGIFTFNSGLLGGRCTWDVDAIYEKPQPECAIWPNPAYEKIYFKNTTGKELDITIFNQPGNIVLKTSTTQAEINIKNLNPGLYFIKIANMPVKYFIKL